MNNNGNTAMPAAAPQTIFGSPFIRLIFYFGLVGLAGWCLVRFFPGLSEVFGLISQPGAGASLPDLGASAESAQSRRWVGSMSSMREAMLFTFFAMGGAILLAIPVAWVYTVSRQAQGYDKSVVQMIILLPIAVAGVVLVVFDNLALAFALGGIVAGVRFRTTLDDVKDAVFAFIAIGIGLAAGIQAFIVSVGLSLVFSLVILIMWKLKFGNVYADLQRTGQRIPISHAMAPGSGETYVAGNPDLIEALDYEQLEKVAEQADQLERHLESNAEQKKKRRYQHLLLVHTSDADKAQKAVDEVLEDHTKRWRLVEIAPANDKTWMLEYIVRLKKSTAPAEFVEIVKAKGEPEVDAVEFRSVEGLNGKNSQDSKNK